MPRRIIPREVHKHRESGADTLLVCAYDDSARCEKLRLEGSISMEEFREQEDRVAPDREIVFYCD